MTDLCCTPTAGQVLQPRLLGGAAAGSGRRACGLVLFALDRKLPAVVAAAGRKAGNSTFGTGTLMHKFLK